MPGLKIVITDHVFPTRDIEERLLVQELGAQVVWAGDAGEAALRAACRDADGVLVTYAKVTAPVVEGMERCRIIARYGIGFDNVAIPTAAAKGIAVTNVPDYCIDEVSDHTIALILALARKVVFLDRSVQGGAWDFRPLTPIFRLRGRTLGIVAYGRIGREVARKAQAFGLQVIAHDPFLKQADVPLVTLEELLRQSDFVSVHAPLLDSTRNLIGAPQLRLMQPQAVIVNTARGGIIDEVALAEALKAGVIAGAGLDVIAREPLPPDHPLRRVDNCILTSHVAFYSEESTLELQEKACRQVIKALTGQPLDYQVNRT